MKKPIYKINSSDIMNFPKGTEATEWVLGH